METIKQTLFSGWHFMRWIRLGFGIFFMVEAAQMHYLLIGVIAGFFLLIAITNIGCCSQGRCAVPKKIANQKTLKRSL